MSFTNLSLRTRFLVIMAAVFIPVLVVALGLGISLQHTTAQFNRLAEQSAYKLQTTVRLQNRIRDTYALTAYLNNMPRAARREQFTAATENADAFFSDLLAQTFLAPAERTLLTTAQQEWRASLVLADRLLTDDAAAAKLAALRQRIGSVLSAVDGVYEIYYREMGAPRQQIVAAENRLLLIIAAVIGFGLIGSVAGALWLARSVTRPLRELEKGMTHFTNDNLTYRLDLHNNDEIGRLARDFNAMAERLMAHQHKLEELSSRDGLTGLLNRREFDGRLSEEVQRAQRYTKPLSILLLDIDHFKNVNDRYGHQAGDEALISVADLIRLNARPMDVSCRYGGEELAMILPETDRSGAHILAERIRATVADARIATYRGDEIQVTVSIGIAAFPLDGDAVAGLISAADRALYIAKQEGRNLVRGF
jgi:diguanylate cyclase (GGDEF)-like protein